MLEAYMTLASLAGTRPPGPGLVMVRSRAPAKLQLQRFSCNASGRTPTGFRLNLEEDISETFPKKRTR